MISLPLVKLPYVYLGERADFWWGSILAGLGMLPGTLVIYGIHLVQLFGLKEGLKTFFDQSGDPDVINSKAYASVIFILLIGCIFFVLRGFAILAGFEGPFDSAIVIVKRYVGWMFDAPSWLAAILGSFPGGNGE